MGAIGQGRIDGGREGDQDERVKLRRSLGFWAGLLVMGFLAWAWWDSCRYDSHYVSGDLGCVGVSSFGGVSLYRDESITSSSGDRTRNGGERRDLLERPFFLRGLNMPPPMEEPGLSSFSPSLYEQYREVMESMPPRVWVVFVPYWLMLVVAGLGWSGMLLWRARRLRRAKAVEGSTMDAVA